MLQPCERFEAALGLRQAEAASPAGSPVATKQPGAVCTSAGLSSVHGFCIESAAFVGITHGEQNSTTVDPKLRALAKLVYGRVH